jgi:hypothetical protein
MDVKVNCFDIRSTSQTEYNDNQPYKIFAMRTLCSFCSLTYDVLRKYKVICARGKCCFKQVIDATNFVGHEVLRQ